MKRMLSAALAALTLGVASIAPAAPAFADDHRGRYSRDYDRGRDHGRHYDRRHYDNRRYDRHRHNNDDDAIVAGVVGLALGAVLGAALASPPQASYAPPPRQQYYAPPQSQPYYNQGYEDRDGYYEDDRTCYRQERQYDRYARRTVTVDVPYAC